MSGEPLGPWGCDRRTMRIAELLTEGLARILSEDPDLELEGRIDRPSLNLTWRHQLGSVRLLLVIEGRRLALRELVAVAWTLPGTTSVRSVQIVAPSGKSGAALQLVLDLESLRACELDFVL